MYKYLVLFIVVACCFVSKEVYAETQQAQQRLQRLDSRNNVQAQSALIDRHYMTNVFSSDSCDDTPPVVTTFFDTDPVVTLFYTWFDADPTDVFREEWHDPDGALLSVFEFVVGEGSENSCSLFWLLIAGGDDIETVPGTWEVKVFLNNELLFSENFTIIDTTPDTDDNKSFVFKCAGEMKRGPIVGLEKLTMNVGDTENCTLKLTNLEPGTEVNVSTQLRKIFGDAIELEPAEGVTDENGEIAITITAIEKGINWAAWAVPNDRGEFKFNKKTFDGGLAWGMFVQVK